MPENKGFQKIGDLLSRSPVKQPAYQWQAMALTIIKELNIPSFKKSAVFKVCRDLPKNFIVRCLVDTKELAKTGASWKYFFKLIEQYPKSAAATGEGELKNQISR